ncbi:MAG TPA: fibronectin type III domain-containing protein, partial [Nocardioidaceae bacterium]|nr:fibronectin type III domain-containing protein [Nocardioidaceae bacterium]
NPPAAPTVLSAYWWGEGDAMFSYRTPANNGAPITGYEWTWKDGDTWQPWRPVTDVPVEDPDAPNGIMTTDNGSWPASGYYGAKTMRVRAVSSEGAGPATPDVNAQYNW